jgi:hypothetical protein
MHVGTSAKWFANSFVVSDLIRRGPDFGSDIGLFEVLDMTKVLLEAYELVEDRRHPSPRN